MITSMTQLRTRLFGMSWCVARLAGSDPGAVSDRPAGAFEPGERGLLDDGLGERGGHVVSQSFRTGTANKLRSKRMVAAPS